MALFRKHKIAGITNPHRQFLLDIQAWVSHLIEERHEVILTMDAYESYDPDSQGISVPLVSTQGYQLTNLNMMANRPP